MKSAHQKLSFGASISSDEIGVWPAAKAAKEAANQIKAKEAVKKDKRWNGLETEAFAEIWAWENQEKLMHVFPGLSFRKLRKSWSIPDMLAYTVLVNIVNQYAESS